MTENNYLHMADLLIAHKSQINCCYKAFQIALEDGHFKLVKLLSKNIYEINNFILGFASSYGNLEIVKFLIKKGANIKVKYNYALRMAAEMAI